VTVLLKTAQFSLEHVPFGTVLRMFDVGRKNKNINYCTLMIYGLRKSGQENDGENYVARGRRNPTRFNSMQIFIYC